MNRTVPKIIAISVHTVNGFPLSNSLVKSIRKTSKFSIYFIYNVYKTTFFPKNVLKLFLHGFSSNQHIIQKPLSEMYTSHFEHFNKKTKNNRFTAYYQIFFIKTFSFISSCVICKVDHCGCKKKICMSWKYFLGDWN